jgi:hypothetical protein
MLRFLTFFALALPVFACHTQPKTAEDETTEETETTIADGTTCYLFSEGQDSTFLTLTINGTEVTGFMAWEPWEKDGARGELVGTLDGNTITADWNYIIEGSEQAEEKVFVLEDDMVGEMTGELTEGEGGKLVLKDPEQAKIGTYLKKTACRENSEE